MSNTETADIRLMRTQLTLQSEIASSNRQILFVIESGAKQTREILQKIKSDNGTRALTAEDYDKIVNYLLSIERKAMYNYSNNEYLKEYYTKIQIQENILNNL